MSGKNVLNNTLDVNNRVHRSPFDKSYQNNLTLNIGQIVPAFCQLCPPGTSIKVNPTFALQFMPMAFPIQTRMRAQLSFYKVPLRTLWKDYVDFVGNFKQGLVPPYLDVNSNFSLDAHCVTGSLGDYLGIPTTSIESSASALSVLPIGGVTVGDVRYQAIYRYKNVVSGGFEGFKDLTINDYKTNFIASSGTNISQPYCAFSFDLSEPSVIGQSRFFLDLGDVLLGKVPNLTSARVALFSNASSGAATKPQWIAFDRIEGNKLVCNLPQPIVEDQLMYVVFSTAGNSNPLFGIHLSDSTFSSYMASTAGTPKIYWTGINVVLPVTLATSPWYNSTSVNKSKQIPLSAYPFRAYESIYNAYYRDNRNNPYVLNGQLEYNKWIPSDAGGADTNIYKIRYKNWEQDFLTTAVQSPQQGIAPLVGLTTYTETLADGLQQTSVSLVDEHGDAYKVVFKGDETSLNDVSYQLLDSKDKSTVVQSRSLYDLATTGISISDLRYVNAYQKYLEMNMRKGYSYRDVIKGHFDTNVRFDALMLPEYLGGVTQDVNMNSIIQTVETSDSGSYAGSLGSMAGNATVKGSSHPISCYCDEESYIIGLLSVSPVPNYSQLLPKHFLHRDLLDSYYPEFDNIGFQPITYKEVCPIQAYHENPDSLSSTFGYQRAWYDYITQVDEVHGLFRTNLRNFLMNRVFAVKPELSESFLLIDPQQTNDVFSVTESSDKIFGQIWFDYTAKLPISRTSIPKLD